MYSIKSKIGSVNVTLLLNLTLVFLLLTMWTGLSLSTSTFLTAGNITNLMRQCALLSILAIGQTLVIITAGIDLSVGALVGLSSVIVALLLTSGVPIPLAILITLVMGAAIGLYHGIAIRKFGIPPFIITLASMSVFVGIGLLITNGATVSGLPKEFTRFSQQDFLGIPSLFWMVIGVGLPMHFLLKQTKWGRHIYSVGSNPEAARLSGIDINATVCLVYVLSGSLAALVGVLTASRISIGLATTGTGWELLSIAAAVIGGASLFGAVGGVAGSVLGALALTTINNGANLLNVNPYWQQIITGFLIVVIVYLDQLRRRR
ncbi:MAG: ABC transporter permease [Sulfitobacter dubius]|uniref:ABC transporter permease n=1 Tax=Roseibium sp. TaxID=1936156 RepID=UPI003296F9DE